jgi:acetylornithine deacetylase/succinyl-diaminopimelate desuccinylase-like protein
MIQDVFDYFDKHRDDVLAELVEFASIPSVSADPVFKPDVERAARWIAERLVRAGLHGVRVVPTAGHPVVYGEWTEAPGASTILIYGHYDVQPADPLEKWTSDPFRAEVREGRLYGRGVSDDKGPLLIPVNVVQAFLATAGALPVNVKFLIEGEEESGSPNLEAFLREQSSLLAADFVLSADGAMWRIDEPSLTVASRGLVGLGLTLTGPAKDLHSGRHGGGVANPLNALAQLVAGLHTSDGRVAVEGFYDDVVELTAAERAAVRALPFDEDGYLREVGTTVGVGEPGYGLLERLWTRPTLDLNGMWGGYQGSGSKTVIPSEAHAKITCRLVPGQDPHDILEKIVAHLNRHAPAGTRLSMTYNDQVCFPYRIADDHVGLTVAAAVLQRLYGRPPVKVMMGASLPACDLFRAYLHLETVFFSFSTADEDYHAPNEFFRIRRLYEGLEAWASYWVLLAAATVSAPAAATGP